ncbi:NAD-dependent succinate-semialdehyde dehydrogenase [Psychroflexus halocasei]|uniref:Succinate-semialdehyde dehydrogenase / glutarate-semialdehyde dehydrogenase n=1 Tax=Psychroflexus halocasei TaxID=908615 RepID=A0A1H3ZHW9_9FLAO|nr:NAD-dependent succinate-semialdehyde dehydrogenase [Psychroflexus halocasei]SEA23257.1 succinate-semialdehyde dehydrogenase / glutarate-semialdehyde dehydrogenase [Psychroflexus halocasei]
MIKSNNPYTQEELYNIEELNEKEINQSIEDADQAFKSWKKTKFSERQKLMLNLAETLESDKKKLAKTITQEMGKPLSQAISEIEKCAWVCEYYTENAESQLADKIIETDAQKSYVSYEPIGVVLAVMPWNYPYWQVFRFLAPQLMAGNVGLLKHASNVMLSAKKIQELVEKAGFPKDVFINLPIKSDQVNKVIQHPKVKAVTLTGSEKAGKAVASEAAKHIKKSVLELGGSNALVVFKDANIDQTLETCVQARFQNTGQSCIAGKRLLIHESLHEEFVDKLITKVKDLKSGDPNDENTFISVMAREDLAEELEKQMQKSVDQGAKIRIGGKRDQAYFEPTILDDVKPGMPVFEEETFGPLLAVTTFKDEKEAIDLVNQSNFGLGVSLFSSDIKAAEDVIVNLEDGAVFINELVKSDPRIPFGGTKTSGYGRELSDDGIMEFINKKTVYIK